MKLIEIGLTRNQLKIITAVIGGIPPTEAVKSFRYLEAHNQQIVSFRNDVLIEDKAIRGILHETYDVLTKVCYTQPLESVTVNRNKFGQWVFGESWLDLKNTDVERHIDLDGVLEEWHGKEIPSSYIEGAFEGQLKNDMIEIECNFKLTNPE